MGHAIEFNGIDDALDIGNTDIPGDRMTQAFWLNADNFDTADARFVSKASGELDSDHYWMVSALEKSKLRFRLRTENMTTTLSSDAGILSPGT